MLLHVIRNDGSISGNRSRNNSRSSVYLLGSRVRVAGLLLAEQRAVHRVVLLQLHPLHLLLDRIHGGACVSSLAHWKKICSRIEEEYDDYGATIPARRFDRYARAVFYQRFYRDRNHRAVTIRRLTDLAETFPITC